MHRTKTKILPSRKLCMEMIGKYHKERGCGKVSKTLFYKPALGVVQKNTSDRPEALGAKLPMASSLQLQSFAAKIPGATSGKNYILSEICVLKLPPFPNVEILSTHVCDRGIRIAPCGMLRLFSWD